MLWGDITMNDAILEATHYLGLPHSEKPLPALSGWQEIDMDKTHVVLTESNLNHLTLYSYQLPIPILSLPLREEWGERHEWIQSEFDNLEKYEHIFLCLDDDEVGRKATIEIARRLGEHRCKLVKLPYKSAHLCMQEGVMREVIHECFQKAKAIDPAELKRADDYLGEIKRGINHVTEAERGYALPWDKAFGTISFRPGELTVWTGINGHGKSQLLGYLMLDQIKQGARVCIASMELAPVKTLIRMTRQAAALKTPTDAYIERICESWGNRLWLFDLVGTAKAERLIQVFTYGRQRYGIDVFVIDSLMKCGFADDDYAGQKRFLDQLSDFKNRFDCHVHVVAHPKKAQDENSPPSKLDVKGVSGITDLADNCMSVWRNKPKEEKIGMDKARNITPSSDDLRKADCHLKCSKQRFGDWEGVITLWFDKESYQYLPSYEAKSAPFVK